MLSEHLTLRRYHSERFLNLVNQQAINLTVEVLSSNEELRHWFYARSASVTHFHRELSCSWFSREIMIHLFSRSSDLAALTIELMRCEIVFKDFCLSWETTEQVQSRSMKWSYENAKNLIRVTQLYCSHLNTACESEIDCYNTIWDFIDMFLSLSCSTIVWYLFSERSKKLNSSMFAKFKAQRISFRSIDILYKDCLKWLTLFSHLQIKASLRLLQQFHSFLSSSRQCATY